MEIDFIKDKIEFNKHTWFYKKLITRTTIETSQNTIYFEVKPNSPNFHFKAMFGAKKMPNLRLIFIQKYYKFVFETLKNRYQRCIAPMATISLYDKIASFSGYWSKRHFVRDDSVPVKKYFLHFSRLSAKIKIFVFNFRN